MLKQKPKMVVLVPQPTAQIQQSTIHSFPSCWWWETEHTQ